MPGPAVCGDSFMAQPGWTRVPVYGGERAEGPTDSWVHLTKLLQVLCPSKELTGWHQ